MTLFSTHIPSILTTEINDNYNNKYVDYSVAFAYQDPYVTSPTQYRTIYKGKSLVIDGKTAIQLDRLLSDYSYRPCPVLTEVQEYAPSNALKGVPSQCDAVELLGDIYYSKIRITFIYGSIEIKTVYMDFSIYAEAGNDNPYQANGTPYCYLDTRIKNHWPALLTENYFIGIDFTRPSTFGYTNEIYMYNSPLCFMKPNIVIPAFGNFSLNYTLKAFLQAMSPQGASIVISGGDAHIVTDEHIIGGSAHVTGPALRTGGASLPTAGTFSGDVYFGYVAKYNDRSENNLRAKRIGTIDACPSDFYLGFWYNGWHSIRCTARKSENNAPFNITNIYRIENNIDNRITHNWTIKTEYMTSEEQKAIYEAVMRSPFFMLYDCANDECHYLLSAQNNVNYTIKKNSKFAEFSLREIKKEYR